MAITLNARTEAIIDSILKSLGVDTVRLAEPPTNTHIRGELRADLSGGESFVQVSNGHLWPEEGTITILDGGDTELALQYSQVLPVGRTGNKRPSYNGVGNPPEARLRLTPGVTVANAHTAPVPIFIRNEYNAVAARALDNGLLGTHDLVGFLKALKEDLEPAVLTAAGFDAAEVISVDGSTAGAQGTGASTALTTEFNDAITADVVYFPATEQADNDYFAIGYPLPWGSVALVNNTQGDDGTVVWEYWNGTAWVALTVAESATNAQHFKADGTVSWTPPDDWETTTSTAMTASGAQEVDELYWVRARIATVYATSNPVGNQGRLGMGAHGVPDAGAFIADTAIGDTVEMVTGTAAGESSTVIDNDANMLRVDPAFSAVIDAGDTYQLNITNYDTYIEELESHVPPNVTSASARGDADTSPTVNAISTTMVSVLVKIIEQYGGSVPANDEQTAQLAREVDRTTRLREAAGSGDNILEVEDATRLFGYTNILVGSTAATIARNLASKGGQGPNQVRIIGTLGGGGEAVGAVVGPNPRGSVETGRAHLAPTPHAFGIGFRRYLDAAIAAVEGHTVPS